MLERKTNAISLGCQSELRLAVLYGGKKLFNTSDISKLHLVEI